MFLLDDKPSLYSLNFKNSSSFCFHMIKNAKQVQYKHKKKNSPTRCAYIYLPINKCKSITTVPPFHWVIHPTSLYFNKFKISNIFLLSLFQVSNINKNDPTNQELSSREKGSLFRRKYLWTIYLLTHSMEQSHSWEANQFSASQDITRILWNP